MESNSVSSDYHCFCYIRQLGYFCWAVEFGNWTEMYFTNIARQNFFDRGDTKNFLECSASRTYDFLTSSPSSTTSHRLLWSSTTSTMSLTSQLEVHKDRYSMWQYLVFVISLLSIILGQYLSDCMKYALRDLPPYYQLSTFAEVRASILRPGEASETVYIDGGTHQVLQGLGRQRRSTLSPRLRWGTQRRAGRSGGSGSRLSVRA